MRWRLDFSQTSVVDDQCNDNVEASALGVLGSRWGSFPPRWLCCEWEGGESFDVKARGKGMMSESAQQALLNSVNDVIHSGDWWQHWLKH